MGKIEIDHPVHLVNPVRSLLCREAGRLSPDASNESPYFPEFAGILVARAVSIQAVRRRTG